MNIDDLKYPVGKFQRNIVYSDTYIFECIENISSLPLRLETLVRSWSPEKWDLKYRPEGWSGRQVMHHLLDSHLNCIIRLKLALTEDTPTIKPYLQDEWIKLADYQLDPMMVLPVLSGIHHKLVTIFRSMSEQDFARTLRHPEHPPEQTLDLLWLIGMYSWHGEHHLGHLKIIDAK